MFVFLFHINSLTSPTHKAMLIFRQNLPSLTRTPLLTPSSRLRTTWQKIVVVKCHPNRKNTCLISAKNMCITATVVGLYLYIWKRHELPSHTFIRLGRSTAELSKFGKYQDLRSDLNCSAYAKSYFRLGRMEQKKLSSKLKDAQAQFVANERRYYRSKMELENWNRQSICLWMLTGLINLNRPCRTSVQKQKMKAGMG